MSVTFGFQGVWGIPAAPLVHPPGFVAARFDNADWATVLIVDGKSLRCVIPHNEGGTPDAGEKSCVVWEVTAERWDDESLEKIKLAWLGGWEPGKPLRGCADPEVQILVRLERSAS